MESEDERYNFSFSHNKNHTPRIQKRDKLLSEIKQPLFETLKKHPVTAFTPINDDSMLTDKSVTVLSAKGPMMNVRKFPTDFFNK